MCSTLQIFGKNDIYKTQKQDHVQHRIPDLYFFLKTHFMVDNRPLSQPLKQGRSNNEKRGHVAL